MLKVSLADLLFHVLIPFSDISGGALGPSRMSRGEIKRRKCLLTCLGRSDHVGARWAGAAAVPVAPAAGSAAGSDAGTAGGSAGDGDSAGEDIGTRAAAAK